MQNSREPKILTIVQIFGSTGKSDNSFYARAEECAGGDEQ
jgi:hypothetical protein